MHSNMCRLTRTHTRTYMHSRMHACTHAYIHTCKHTYSPYTQSSWIETRVPTLSSLTHTVHIAQNTTHSYTLTYVHAFTRMHLLHWGILALTYLPPNERREKILLPNERREKILPPNERREKILLPNERREKILPPNERREKTLLPNERGEKILSPNERREKILLPNERREKILPPNERREKILPPNERREKILLPNERREKILPPNERREILPPNERRKKIANVPTRAVYGLCISGICVIFGVVAQINFTADNLEFTIPPLWYWCVVLNSYVGYFSGTTLDIGVYIFLVALITTSELCECDQVFELGLSRRYPSSNITALNVTEGSNDYANYHVAASPLHACFIRVCKQDRRTTFNMLYYLVTLL